MGILQTRWDVKTQYPKNTTQYTCRVPVVFILVTSFYTHAPVDDWELQLTVLPNFTRVCNWILQAQEKIKIQNLKYSLQ